MDQIEREGWERRFSKMKDERVFEWLMSARRYRKEAVIRGNEEDADYWQEVKKMAIAELDRRE